MTTSASIDFSVSRDDIITEALELIGAIGIGDSPSANDLTSCSRTLNMMVKEWQGTGIHLWTATQMTVTLIAATASYILSPRPLYVKAAQCRNTDNVDRPVRVDSRTAYFQISNKTDTGQVNRVYYDPQLASGTLYVYPTPVTGVTDTLILTYIRSLEDFDAAGNTPDFPQEWYSTLANNLALRVAPKYGKSAPDEVKSVAISSLVQMQLWDTESSRVRIVPASSD